MWANRLPIVVALVLVSLAPRVDLAAQNRSSSRRARPTLAGVATIRNLSSLRNSWDYVSKLAAPPQVRLFADSFLVRLSTTSESGLDTRRPLGVMVYTTDGQESQALVFAPVGDQAKFESFFKSLEPNLGPMIGAHPHRTTRRWFFAGPALQHLKPRDLPDPDRQISRRAREYDVAYTIRPSKFPVDLRRKIRALLETTAESPFGAFDERERGRQLAAQGMLMGIDQFFDEVDELTFGLKARPAQRNVALDVVVTARRGSALSRSLTSVSKSPSQFANLFDSRSPLSWSVNARLPEDVKKFLLSQVAELGANPQAGRLFSRGAGGRAGSELESRALGLMRENILAGKLDMAVSMKARPGGGAPLTVVGGAHLTNPAQVEALMKQEARGAGFKIDVEKYRGVSIHELDVPPEDDQAEKLFGPNPKMHVAYTKRGMYFALGASSLDEIKWALRQNENSRPAPGATSPLRLEVLARPWLDVYLDSEPGEVRDPDLARAYRGLSPSDGFRIELEAIANGLRCRVEVDEGLIALIGQRTGAGGGGSPPPSPFAPSHR